MDFIQVLRESLGNGVVAFDQRRLITAVNSRAEQLTGLSAASLIGQPVSTLPSNFSQIAAELLATGRPLSDLKVPLFKDKVFQVAATPVFAEPGKVTGGLLVFSDISWTAKWENNLRQADRLNNVGIIYAGMAHEIRNAFVAVRTFVDLLLEKNPDAELADVVGRELRRIDRIIKEMLGLPVKPIHTHQHIHEVLDNSLVLIQHLLEAKQVKLDRSFGAAVDALPADPNQLEQAFLNLFFNALDAMSANGLLRVTTAMIPVGSTLPGTASPTKRELVRVTISDTGSGIAPENLQRLFEPFFTTKASGTGLGLSITRRIIEAHQGSIAVESELNKGTSFHLYFPVAST